jgi:uncharacterized protein (TIGR02231 family)
LAEQGKQKMKSHLFLVAAFVLTAAPAIAADIPVSTAVGEVTVFLDGATISRRGATDIPAGEHRLVITRLPADLEPDKFRLDIASNAITMGALDFEQITTNQLVSPEERAITLKQQGLLDLIAAVDDEIATAQMQLRILDSLAQAPQGGTREPAVTGANIPTALASAGQGSLAARAKIREANGRRRGLAADLAVVQADLQKVTSGRKATTRVTVNIRAAQPVAAASIGMQYESENASWRPSYTARLESRSAKLNLLEQARLQQQTGEDWRSVALTLNSGRPSDAMEPGRLNSLFVDLRDPAPPPPPPPSPVYAPAPRGYAEPVPVTTISSDIIVTAAKRDEADVVASSYAVEYKIPGRSNVESDREPRLFPIAETSWDVKLIARAVPSEAPTAFASARFTNTGKTPIRGGEMQIFRDGAYSGAVSMRTVLPGEDTTLALGSDERIRIRVEEEASGSGSRGTLKKENVDERRVRFDITSMHDEPVVLEVLDRVPVPRNKDIKVEMLRGATPPTESKFEGRAGIYMWRLTLEPRKQVVITHAYSVQFPKGRLLSEEEVEDSRERGEED